MFGLSFTHILVLLVLALIFIGPEQLPELARTLGRFINEIKRTTNTMASDIKQSTRDENIRQYSKTIEDHNRKIAADHLAKSETLEPSKKDPDEPRNS
jgi:sec-independent protein translocase protein TatB